MTLFYSSTIRHVRQLPLRVLGSPLAVFHGSMHTRSMHTRSTHTLHSAPDTALLTAKSAHSPSYWRSVHVPHPLLLLLVRPLPDKVDRADLLEALRRIWRLVRGPKAVDRESGEEVALRLVVRPVEGAVRVIVVREVGAYGEVEQPGG